MISQDEVKQLVDRSRHVESQMDSSRWKSGSKEPRPLIAKEGHFHVRKKKESLSSTILPTRNRARLFNLWSTGRYRISKEKVLPSCFESLHRMAHMRVGLQCGARRCSQFLTDRINTSRRKLWCHARTSEMTSPHTEIPLQVRLPG
jgi:hypothetical protein